MFVSMCRSVCISSLCMCVSVPEGVCVCGNSCENVFESICVVHIVCTYVQVNVHG